MPEAAVPRWKAMAQAVLENVPGSNKNQKLINVGNKMGADLSYVRRIVFGRGRRGVRPDTVYAFGEACGALGVPWSSGLLMLALTEPYRVHAFGTLGVLLAQRANLRAIFSGIVSLLKIDHKNLYQALEQPAILARLAFTPKQRSEITKAWAKWYGSEKTDGMPDILRSYVAMLKAPVGNRVSIEYHAALFFVESCLFEWMDRAQLDWSRFSRDFLADDDILTDTRVRILA